MKYNLLLELNSKKDYIKPDTITILYKLLHAVIYKPGMLKYKYEEIYKYEEKSNRLFIDISDPQVTGHIIIESGQLLDFEVQIKSSDIIYGINPDGTAYLRKIIPQGMEGAGIYEFSTNYEKEGQIVSDENFFVSAALRYYDVETLRYFNENSIPYEKMVYKALEQCGIEPDIIIKETSKLNKENSTILENSCSYLEKHIGLVSFYPQMIKDQKGKAM